MRKLTALLAISALLVAIGAVSAFAATKSVKWHVPTSSTIKISKGTTVKWTWTDGAPHNVKGPGFASKTIAKKGFTFSHKFGKKGTFKIICQVHPTSMKTVVKVG
jgi:plastocyanin